MPTLVRDDATVLTEFSAVATWLARTNPAQNLIPADPGEEARAVEVISYVEGTIHGQGFARVFAPGTACAKWLVPVVYTPGETITVSMPQRASSPHS